MLWLMLFAGFVMLMVGGEILVRGSVNAARKLGVSPLLIGLTLVGFGTSMPEMVTSVQAAYAGSPGIAVGNIVGSNIANILLILGASALVMPVAVAREALYRDGFAVVAVTILFIVISLTMPLGKAVGLFMLALLAAYLTFVALQDRAAVAAQVASGDLDDNRGDIRAILGSTALAVVGMAIVVAGGYALVEAAIGIARTYDISEAVIGLTIVAIGTSMPELATSLVAALRGQSDLAVGNVLGSNLFNLLAIGGTTATLAPVPVEVPTHIAHVDNFIMLGAAIGLLILGRSGHLINRWEGALLLSCYAAYLVSLTVPGVFAGIM